MKRRDFIKNSAALTAGVIGLPAIVPASVLGKNAPSNKIQLAQIGFGRIAQTHDLPETLKHDVVQAVAVADVDIKRANQGKKWLQSYYAKKTGKKGPIGIKVYQDYR